MSIRVRFTFALTAVGVVLFVTYALWAYHSERDELREAATREIRVIGRSLEVSIANALRDKQGADIDETLTTLELQAPDVDIHIHDPAGRAIAHSHGAVLDPLIEQLVNRAESTRRAVRFDPPDDPTRLIFVAPLVGDDGELLGRLGIARDVADLDADLARTRRRLIAVVAAFLLATVIAGLVLGTIHVRRPIARLVAGVRQARAGDFRGRVRPGRDDEIGELVDEFNAMIGALAEQRARAEAEAEARVRLVRGLQRVDKLVTIGQLSAGLAHEIGSPLQVLSGRATALLEHADPEVRRQAEQLVAQGERITRIVEQLLSFGRRKAAVVAPCDLTVPVRTVADLLSVEARRRGVALALEVGGGPHVIEGDVDQLQQLALNLLRNALAATDEGGHIVARVERAGERVRLTVRDDGVGMDAETKARLFEPFFTTRASDGGTGLGLAVVRAIADEHRAQLEVRSEPGRGAELVVDFPAPMEVARG